MGRSLRALLGVVILALSPLASAEEIAAHEMMLAVIAKASGGRVLWVALEPPEPAITVVHREEAAQRSSA